MCLEIHANYSSGCQDHYIPKCEDAIAFEQKLANGADQKNISIQRLQLFCSISIVRRLSRRNFKYDRCFVAIHKVETSVVVTARIHSPGTLVMKSILLLFFSLSVP